MGEKREKELAKREWESFEREREDTCSMMSGIFGASTILEIVKGRIERWKGKKKERKRKVTRVLWSEGKDVEARRNFVLVYRRSSLHLSSNHSQLPDLLD